MEQADFTLKSGAKLHLSSGAWEKVVALWSAVKLVTIGKRDEPEVGHIILSSPNVQKAVYEMFQWATYENMQLYSGIFDEQKLGGKARMDYLEICEKIIEFQLRPFFLTTSSPSTDSSDATLKNQKQP